MDAKHARRSALSGRSFLALKVALAGVWVFGLFPTSGTFTAVAFAQEGLAVDTEHASPQVARKPMDFIIRVGEFIPKDSPTTKREVLALLAKLTAGAKGDANPDLAAAWNLLDQTEALTPAEKAAWVEARLADLPVPFAMLGAVHKSSEDPVGAMELFLAARIQQMLDSAKCRDPEAELAGYRLHDRLLFRMSFGIDRSRATEEEITKALIGIRQEAKARAFELYPEIAKNILYPWWVAHAGRPESRAGLSASKPESEAERAERLFKPKSEWPEIERELITDYQSQLDEEAKKLGR